MLSFSWASLRQLEVAYVIEAFVQFALRQGTHTAAVTGKGE